MEQQSQSGGSDSSLTVDDNSSSNSSSDSNMDPESLVDGTSSKFNPLIALHIEQKALRGFRSDSPRYLHVFELEKAIPDPTKAPIKKSNLTLNQKPKKVNENNLIESAKREVKEVVADDSSKPSGSNKTEEKGTEGAKPIYPMPGRKFLPHQMPVYRPPKKHPNVLTVMEEVKGPLSVVRDAVKNKRRIKIWTRGVTGVRGFCTAFVVAFDHHWNLALREVHEIFQRRRADNSREENRDEDQKEKEEYRVGKYLREVSSCRGRSGGTTVQDMKKNQRRPLIVDSSDALLTLRNHSEELICNKRFQKPPDGGKSRISSENKVDCIALSGSQLRKKRLTIFKEPVQDPFGFSVVARSRNFEIVERFEKQLFLVGNEIVFIETSPS